jgi:hypothetical protein
VDVPLGATPWSDALAVPLGVGRALPRGDTTGAADAPAAAADPPADDDPAAPGGSGDPPEPAVQPPRSTIPSARAAGTHARE